MMYINRQYALYMMCNTIAKIQPCLVCIILDLCTITLCIMHTWAIYLHECIITVFNSILEVRILSFTCLKKKREEKMLYH